MMYWGYPRITLAQRYEQGDVVDAARVRVAPSQAFARLNTRSAPRTARLTMLDGRPAYTFDHSVVFADTGESLPTIPQEMALRIASTWAKLDPAQVSFRGVEDDVDQWTVNPSVKNYGPFWKFGWSSGDELYVSRATGEVAQHTTRASRITSYFGAIPHWIYFTPLRRDPKLWNQVVTWASGIGTLMSLFGIIVGVWLYSPSKRYRFPGGASSIPYSGQKRWHTILGLVFGLVTSTWVLSGMFSMSPLPWLKNDGQGTRVAQALRPPRIPVAAFDAKQPAEAILSSGLAVKQLELVSFAGRPVYIASAAPFDSKIIPVHGQPAREFERTPLVAAVTEAFPGKSVSNVRLVTEHEAYYVDRRGERPLPVWLVRLNDPEGSMYYIDPATAQMVVSYAEGGRWNRWLYHGLHSFDLPLLYKYRPAWDIVVMLLMLGGTALCVTSVVIAWRRLKRKAAMVRA
jgi:hypothetical protein